MRFLLLICGDTETAGEQAADPALVEACERWKVEQESRGVQITGTGLRPPDEATTLRVRDGQVLLTDGPFAETKEQIGGFSVLECADHEEAVKAAATHPWATYGSIEVRPIWA
ncbi:hypothetical protein EV193_106388 [Herbihabitans rhizosphaerae]|uniref:YCII-related domain-containing protein n=1 Tax=Herbihabitans rhizosphaerae TaxID=1872711 RepID=A0A4Q7KMK4_9PSEU|nr:YciI family protein [Herbihabitans rhizosphaerae]RZS37150.1 hypothetical protein EV193_106388 [Herbihabitans rhizosphaerae]